MSTVAIVTYLFNMYIRLTHALMLPVFAISMVLYDQQNPKIIITTSANQRITPPKKIMLTAVFCEWHDMQTAVMYTLLSTDL